mgnify:CR=1 FL=1|tara:strand:+ start:112 stop:1434 length:1323 start_codon:yes stop_codon:yes gene_type:complete
MKILLLDKYKDSDCRISKDTSGGYGTGNDFGDTFTAKYLKKKLKKIHDWPALFAAYTYAVLKKQKHQIFYTKEIPSSIESYDLFIVVSSIVCCEDEVLAIKEIKKQKENIFAIGPFATSNPQKYVDAGASVISGEPEFYFLGNNNFETDLKKDIILFNHKFGLDDLPYPDWEDLIGKNKDVSNLFGNYNSLPILGTRGCPYSCFKYCVYPLQQGRKVRQRSPKKIVDEMEYWKKRNINMFIFRDPVFSINRKHTVEFCEELIQRNLNVRFIIETHLKILDSELLKILKKAGLKAVKVGVESYDENVLKESGRFSVTKDEQLEKIREIEKNDIQISAMFILGFPTDNETTISKTIDYAKKLNTTYAQFSVWTPYPGTPVFNEYKDKIIVNEYNSFDQYHLVYKHDLFDEKTIRKYLSKAYSMYYLRVNWLFKYFKFFIYSK